MNTSDTDRLLGFLERAGYEETREPQEADLILINTCSVRDKPQQKVYSAAGRYKSLKGQKPNLIVGICGCVAQQEGERLLERMPYLDLVFGPQSIHRINELLKEVREGKERTSDTPQIETISPEEFPSFAPRGGETRAFVSIMRGCDNFCAYCIVPFTRGREVSRTSKDILEEVASLVEGGITEVTLLGQNVNSYGQKRLSEEIASDPSDADRSFTALLKEVCAVDGIKRVRFVTSHPKDISDELIYLFATEPKLARHLHLPLQSGSDDVLERMGRGYTRESYLKMALRIRELYEDISLTTDIIVGFPGETDEDFSQTMDIIEKLRYDSIFSFKYSPRPGTLAESFTDEVDEQVKSRRLLILQERHKEIALEENRALIGATASVFIEGVSRNDPDELMGRTSCNRVVNLKSTGLNTETTALTGSIVKVSITDAFANSLRGFVVDESDSIEESGKEPIKEPNEKPTEEIRSYNAY